MNQRRKENIKIISATGIGTMLEWFDFTLFGILSKLVSDKFFPTADPRLSLLATFGAFAVGFFTRPIGAIFIGHLGDKLGRKRAFLLTILLMVIPTMLIGLLPTYQDIGILSPIILVVLRIFQGFSVSGEHGGAITYLSEYSNSRRRGLISAIPMASANGGMLLASISGFLLATIFNEQQIHAWAWRIPFLLSVILGLIAWYLRSKMEETEIFKKIQKEKRIQRFPLKEVLKKHRKLLLLSTFSFLISAAYPYLLFFYLPNATEKFIHEDISSHVLILNSISLLLAMVSYLVAAWISDFVGRKKVMVISAGVLIIITIPLFYIFPMTNIWNMFIFQIIGTIAYCSFTGPWAAATAENFPDNIRFSGISVSLNLAASIFGGTAPIILTAFAFLSHSTLYSGLYFTLLSIVSFIMVLLSKYKNTFVSKN
ncbi:MAG: MFS transporter [Hyphomicrobiales bacterium]